MPNYFLSLLLLFFFFAFCLYLFPFWNDNVTAIRCLSQRRVLSGSAWHSLNRFTRLYFYFLGLHHPCRQSRLSLLAGWSRARESWPVFTQKEQPIKGAVVKLLCYTGVWNCCFDWLDFKLPFKSGRPNHVSREPLVSRAQAKKDKRLWGSEWAWISLWTGCLVKNVFIPSFNSFNERSQNAIHLLTTNCVFT